MSSTEGASSTRPCAFAEPRSSPVFERLGDVRSRGRPGGRSPTSSTEGRARRGPAHSPVRGSPPVYERLGDARSRAVTWGKVADILFLRGELDEALRIRRSRSCPSTSGSAMPGPGLSPGAESPTSVPAGRARSCLRLQSSHRANRRFGDIDGIAASLWGLAQIDLAGEDYVSAAPRAGEATSRRPDSDPTA